MTFRLRGPSLLLLGIAAIAGAEPDAFLLGNGSDGAKTVSTWETVNTYAQVVEPLIPGDVSFEVEPDAAYPLNVAANDLVLVVQAHGVIPNPGTNGPDPMIALGDAGNYELARVQSVTAGSTSSRVRLTLTKPLWRAYASMVTQVVFVPEFTTVTINSGQGIWTPAWNGRTGGVLAFLATGAITNHGDIDAWGSGFRGGVVNGNDSTTACVGEDLAGPRGAGKGEGVGGTGYPTASGRGYRANGGGGGICQNSGGGGGGAVGRGGPGGNSTSGTAFTGGRGGASLTYLPYERLLFGGGGGAGQQDNSSGGRGGTGAGIIFIRAASLSGGGWIYADAEEGQDSSFDGAGGGGGGGTVVVRLTGGAACGSVSAWGGNGGSVTGAGTPGPGGGGGGGSVLVQGSGWSTLNCGTSGIAGTNGDNTVGPNGAGSGDPGAELMWSTALALPAAPAFTAPSSGAFTNDNTPTISGTVPEAFPALQALVFIDGVWRGMVTANASEAWTFVAPTLSDGLHTVVAHTQNRGIHSVASSTRSFTVDTVTPGSQFTATPPTSSNDTTPTFSFNFVESFSTTTVNLQCSLDGATFTSCSSPLTTGALSEGSHNFRVRARDLALNTDPTPASHTWTVDLTPPDGNCTNEPPALTNQRVWSFPLTSTETGSTFRCKLDGAAVFTACSTPYLTPSLGDGAHRLEVQAVDAALNVDPSPFVSDWTVDGTPPETTLLTAPTVFTTTTRFSFEFGSSEPGLFLCSLDGAPFSACTSPQDPTLADGPHTFVVYAADPAGNVDPTPESYSWTIDTVAPDTLIDSGPPTVTNQSSAVFLFSSPEAGVAFQCSVDGAVFSSCVSPLTVTSLGVGTHTFQVRARDSAGNQDSTVAQQLWSVVLDADGDGLEDAEELLVGTSPDRPDTDGDGLSDFVEVRTGGSEPLDGDSDDDGLLDGREDLNADGIQQPSESSTRNRDSDGDGLSDGVERGLSTPQGPHTDLILFVADAQPSTTTDPALADTDGDGLEDGMEDLNRDGAKAATETDPARADSDSDGIGDGVELRGTNPTDPLNPDSDQDQLLDGEEDLDHNGAVDPEETDPNSADTDQGGVLDGVERQGTSNPLDGDDDYGVRGGGCASTGSGPLWWMGLLVLGLMRRKRLAGLLLAGASSAVLAQPVLSTAIDLQQLKPAPGADAILGLHGAGLDPHLGWRAGLFLSYGANPLTLVVTANDQPVRQVISGQATADLLGAISLWDRLEIGLALPVSYQLSDGLSLGAGTTAIAPAGVGDLRLVPKVKLLEAFGLRLGAVAEVSAPTGAADAFLGSGGFSARPRLVADWAPLPAFRVLVNGGANLRAPQRLLNLVVGHEATYGAAVEGALPWAGLQLAAGVAGAVGLSTGASANHPLELLASARLPLGRHFQLTVGGGAGVGSGYGTPSYRMLAAFSYQSARGVALELPPPPAVVTPVDPDPDRDGIPSTVDECDDKPETRNDFRDEDGCPDTLPGENAGPVVKDQDKDGVLDDQDLCPGLPGEADEDGCPPDDDNDGIVNPLDLCPTRKEVINGFEDEDGCPDKLPRQNTRRRR